MATKARRQRGVRKTDFLRESTSVRRERKKNRIRKFICGRCSCGARFLALWLAAHKFTTAKRERSGWVGRRVGLFNSSSQGDSFDWIFSVDVFFRAPASAGVAVRCGNTKFSRRKWLRDYAGKKRSVDFSARYIGLVQSPRRKYFLSTYLGIRMIESNATGFVGEAVEPAASISFNADKLRGNLRWLRLGKLCRLLWIKVPWWIKETGAGSCRMDLKCDCDNALPATVDIRSSISQ